MEKIRGRILIFPSRSRLEYCLPVIYPTTSPEEKEGEIKEIIPNDVNTNVFLAIVFLVPSGRVELPFPL